MQGAHDGKYPKRGGRQLYNSMAIGAKGRRFLRAPPFCIILQNLFFGSKPFSEKNQHTAGSNQQSKPQEQVAVIPDLRSAAGLGREKMRSRIVGSKDYFTVLYVRLQYGGLSVCRKRTDSGPAETTRQRNRNFKAPGRLCFVAVCVQKIQIKRQNIVAMLLHTFLKPMHKLPRRFG